MSPTVVTMRRTLGFARNFLSTALAFGGFLAATGVMFAFNLRGAEDGTLALASVWAVSVAPVLPVLAAVLSMDVWSDERLSGRMELLLTAPVPERDLVAGKFLGVWLMSLAAVLASLVSSVALVRLNAPAATGASALADFVPGLAALGLQGALWCAVSVAASAFFRHAAASALVSCALLVAVPRGLWAAFAEWSAQGRDAFGEMPFDAHVADFASGVFPSGPVMAYALLVLVALFVCTKRVEALRLVGRRAAGARLSTFVAVSLAVVFAVLATALAMRMDVALELPLGSVENRISQRTRDILAESHGTIVATCLLRRSDQRFRKVAQVMRALRREAASQGGADIALRFVDPRWDFAAAKRLAGLGVDCPSVVFESGRRRAVLPIDDGVSERHVASALRRLTAPPHRSSIYWTSGHGEASFDEYGAFGMSDIARELSRDGYGNYRIDLSGDAAIPPDCALIVVAGGKEDLSRIEAERLGSYLKRGGRMLVLMEHSEGGGLVSLLAAWGIRVSSARMSSARTLSGSDVVASDFSAHPATAPLAGSQIVLERPLTFVSSSAAGGVGADRIEFSPLASAGGQCVAAAAERGGATGEDLAMRPTRIVAVGDSLFAMNGPLASRANANRDFFLNCVAYLAGTGAMTAAAEGGTLSTGMDRRAWTSFAIQSGVGVPGVAFLLLLAYVAGRRRRS